MNYNKGCYSQPDFSGWNMGKKYSDFHKTPVCKMQNKYSDKNSTGCPEMNYKLGMVYSPYQEWQNIYPGEKALNEGTIFEELNKPFLGYKNNKGGCCL